MPNVHPSLATAGRRDHDGGRTAVVAGRRGGASCGRAEVARGGAAAGSRRTSRQAFAGTPVDGTSIDAAVDPVGVTFRDPSDDAFGDAFLDPSSEASFGPRDRRHARDPRQTIGAAVDGAARVT